jgi:hypothetical protein
MEYALSGTVALALHHHFPFIPLHYHFIAFTSTPQFPTMYRGTEIEWDTSAAFGLC